MAIWILMCPDCGTKNEAPKETIRVKCGSVYYHGACINCGKEFEGRQEYWRWLGLAEGPPLEGIAGHGYSE